MSLFARRKLAIYNWCFGAELGFDHAVSGRIPYQLTHRMDFEFAHDIGAMGFGCLDTDRRATATSLLLLPSARSCTTSRSLPLRDLRSNTGSCVSKYASKLPLRIVLFVPIELIVWVQRR